MSTPPPPVVLQFSPLGAPFDAELRLRFDLQHWSQIADHDAWLAMHAGEVRALVTGANVGVPGELLGRFPALGLIAIFGVGFDKVDVAEARRRGIRVSNTPDVLTDDVADLALALTIALLRELPAAERHVKSGAWGAGPLPLGRSASGRRMGIIGLGRIGKAIAARMAVLGPVAYTGSRAQAVPYAYVPSVIELARTSSILIVAASPNAANHHLVGREVLDALGPRGYLINVARGSLVDEAELTAALAQRRIAGAALDVFEEEPAVSPVLRALNNVVLTPHIGSATYEAREAMGRLVLANLDAFFAGADLPSAVT